jgi:hypothetical protein
LYSPVSVDSSEILNSSELFVVSVPVDAIKSHTSVILYTSGVLNASKTVDVSLSYNPEVTDSS